MDCEDCCQQEIQHEQRIVHANQALSYRGWLGHSRSYQNFSNNVRPEQPKVSLKRRNKQNVTEPMHFQPQLKIASVKTMYDRTIPKNSSYSNMTYRPNPSNAQPNIITPSAIYHPPINFTRMPMLRESLPAQIHTVSERHRTSFMGPVESLNPQKMLRPQINITYDLKNEAKITNLQNLPLAQIQPLKVEFGSCPSPTSAEKDSQKIQRIADTNNMNDEQKPRPSQLFSLENEAAKSIPGSEMGLPIRKSSIQFRNNVGNFDQNPQILIPVSNLTPNSLNSRVNNNINNNRGKLSHIQLKKVASFDRRDDQDINKSTGMIKSMRITEQHLDQIECKKTESIADANGDSESSQQSLVIMDMNDIRLRAGNKMTTSDIKRTEPSIKIVTTPKRSIIWETSRKQSYSEL